MSPTERKAVIRATVKAIDLLERAYRVPQSSRPTRKPPQRERVIQMAQRGVA